MIFFGERVVVRKAIDNFMFRGYNRYEDEIRGSSGNSGI